MLVPILPFIEQQALWEKISNPNAERTDGNLCGGGNANESLAANGANPRSDSIHSLDDGHSNLPLPQRSRVWASRTGANELRRLPRRFLVATPFSESEQQSTAVTPGRSRQSRAAHRGFFMPLQEAKFRDCLDGLANTIAMGEIVTDLGDNNIRGQVTESARNSSAPGVSLGEHSRQPFGLFAIGQTRDGPVFGIRSTTWSRAHSLPADTDGQTKGHSLLAA